jgi:bifunctional DNase/RNase
VKATSMIEVLVAGLGMARPSSSPLLLLKERDGERVLPIGIGPLEAHAIAMPLQGVRPPRPMTHDVFAEVIADLGGQLRRVEITDLTDNTFHARLMVDQVGTEHTIDIRPSDAVALAVRTETPIYVGGVPGDGADGIFYATNLATRGMLQPEECARFQRPYDLRVLGAAADFVAPEFIQLVEELPGLRIVVEHLGSVRLADPRREEVFELTRYPNL